jgi:hypothetical protein
MIERRAFLQTLAGGLVLPSRLFGGGTGVCVSDNFVYAPAPSQAPLAHTYRFPKLADNERPLWSQMTPGQKNAYEANIRKAYGWMIQRSLRNPNDPAGLLFQGRFHRDTCAGSFHIHGNSNFLPWHRAFLYFHERWLQRALGDETFRLAAWDWENNSQVPQIFDWLQIPNSFGSAGSYLGCTYLANTQVSPIDQQQLVAWLLSHCFIDFAGGSGTPPNAAGGVHAIVHAQLGGLMGYPTASALHPVFYMHHANVDRYWCTWTRDYGSYDGFKPEWIDTPWIFFDPRKGAVKVTVGQVVDTTRLGYHYSLPPPTLYQATNICAVTYGNYVSLNPNALLALLTRLSGERANAAVFPTDPTQSVMELTAAVLAQSKFKDLAFPVRLEFQAQDLEPGVYYPITLRSPDNSYTAPIGGVSVFGEHDHGNVKAFGSVKLSDLQHLWPSAYPSGWQVALGGPANLNLSLREFSLLYPELALYPDDAKLNQLLGVL